LRTAKAAPETRYTGNCLKCLFTSHHHSALSVQCAALTNGGSERQFKQSKFLLVDKVDELIRFSQHDLLPAFFLNVNRKAPKF
jgi:hypothetical protein